MDTHQPPATTIERSGNADHVRHWPRRLMVFWIVGLCVLLLFPGWADDPEMDQKYLLAVSLFWVTKYPIRFTIGFGLLVYGVATAIIVQQRGYPSDWLLIAVCIAVCGTLFLWWDQRLMRRSRAWADAHEVPSTARSTPVWSRFAHVIEQDERVEARFFCALGAVMLILGGLWEGAELVSYLMVVFIAAVAARITDASGDGQILLTRVGLVMVLLGGCCLAWYGAMNPLGVSLITLGMLLFVIDVVKLARTLQRERLAAEARASGLV